MNILRRYMIACWPAAAFFVVLAVSSARAETVGDVGSGEINAAKPGQILRVWPQPGGTIEGARAFRILYRSTSIEGKPIALSGAVIIPDEPAPEGGRKIVAWAHPTTGVVKRCAPTLLPNFSDTIPGLDEMIARGYVIAATDYKGLGTPGMHPYLIGKSEAIAVLDSVRAARQLPNTHAGSHFAVWGHSQGGHAALFTGELAASYAPELKLVGVAAAAPATYLAELFDADYRSLAGDTLTAMALLSWSQFYKEPLDTILDHSAKESFEEIARDCIETIAELVQIDQAAQGLPPNFLSANPTKVEPWKSIMARNSPGQAPAGAPVFIAQGTADDIVRPQITRQFADHLCAQGTRVVLIALEGASHTFAGVDSASRAVAWMADRFAGKRAPTDCGK